MSTPPPFSPLDYSQVLKGSFDDATGSLRTTVVNIVEDPETGATEVSINDTDDSIKIGNGSGQYLAINSDGSINVEGNIGNNASVGTVNTTAPTSGTEIAGVDSSGDLRAVSVDSSGVLNVNVVSQNPSLPQQTLSTYNEVSSVASGSTITVLTYTVPVGFTLYLNKVLVSSDSIAQMDLQFNSATNARKRLSYTLFNETFDYSLNGDIGGYELVAGTVVTVVGTNLNTDNAANFNATLQGVQQ